MNLLKAGQAAVYLVPSRLLVVHSLIYSGRRIKAFMSLYNTIPYSYFIIQNSFARMKRQWGQELQAALFVLLFRPVMNRALTDC